ncbi:DUF445 domain-containing protein [Sphingomicrobium astaxanthinifaciens]|uniref:DUF445 domain-containing protein n=1 Tax=Sphingomicrobium astaxanthinifaciens TaxID=1227949 RepID=UPI001FCBD312|nr:DUF445 domain-containing protein [Sphingomicrobium astaxanthinifaciens]MCJ7420840.1 DUF445 domain-containing protein [Sphingomicrobium astaxanthinifaciens]
MASGPVPLSRFSSDQPGAGGMKRLATGLLVLMALLYFSSRQLEPAYPWLEWVEAFAEAAMVGALADWFAVTALFRHPLGLPIPHTAIIPKNKDRIGTALSRFIRENFLVAPVIARRMRKTDVAGAIGRFLAHPSGGETRMRSGASRLIADAFEGLDDERLGGIAKDALKARLKRMNVSPVIGRALAVAINEDRHLPAMEKAIAYLANALDDNEHMIRDMVYKRTSWLLRLATVDERIADQLVEGLRKLFRDMEADPGHPVRVKIEHQLADLANNLQTDPALMAKVEQWKVRAIENSSVALWLDDLWQRFRTGIIEGAHNPDGAMAGQLGEVLGSIGHSLETDARLKAAINRFTRRAAAGMAASYGDNIVTLVSDTVRSWDATTVTERLEGAVGRDLQYIRINGTLVGGLVGTGLHALGKVGI